MEPTLVGKNTNCIKYKFRFELEREFEQYDSYGSKIFNFSEYRKCCGNQKYMIYDIDEKIIGSVENQMNCGKKTYIFYDEDNQMINYIESNNDCCSCCSFTYNFYGADKNIENILIKKNGCCSTVYELYDKYNTLTNRAEFLCKSCCKNYYYEYDVNNSDKVFKIDLNPFKIFENENEVDLTDKTLFNNGFSKIQIFLIVDSVLFPSGDDGSANN